MTLLEISLLFLTIRAIVCRPSELTLIGASTALIESSPAYSRIPVIEVIGSKFFFSNNGSQFFMKGIAYQQTYSNQLELDATSDATYMDPLAHLSCLRDVKYFKELGINLVRVYSIDPKANHDDCMNAFASAGIYVLTDLAEPLQSINRINPSWDTDLYNRYTQVVDSMQKYNNVLGFFAGNEVTNDGSNTPASPYVKAAVRDIKNYIRDRGYREVPVGYATNDDAAIRRALSSYFICDNDDSSRIDFLGINMYEWCGYSTYISSGYRERTEEMKDFPVPIFFSEYGCNIKRPRPFTEVEALYGPSMVKVWSGGIAYMYFEEENKYGVVSIGKDRSVTKLEDFNNLKNELSKTDPKGVEKNDYVSTISAQFKNPLSCQMSYEVWKASSVLPPTPDPGKCECLQTNLSCILTPYRSVNEHEALLRYCSQIDCSPIMSDSAAGVYGVLSDCGVRQKLSWAINELYAQKKLEPKGCDFNGEAVYIGTSKNQLDAISLPDGRNCLEALYSASDVLGITLEQQTPFGHIKSYNNTSQIPFRTHGNNYTNVSSSGTTLKARVDYEAILVTTTLVILGFLAFSL